VSPRSRVILPPLNLTEEVVLLALGARRSRLRTVVKAAAHADGEPQMTLRGALRSLRAAGLVERVGRRRHAPTAAAAHVERRRLLGAILFYPRGAAPREIDLAVLLLLSGTMPTRAQRLTRGLLVALPDRQSSDPQAAVLLPCPGLGEKTTAPLHLRCHA
jgi:hypothetical protein